MSWPFSVENLHLLPLLLVGLLPILLHWLDRRRARVIDWPAVRFLVPRDRSRLRRIQRREALLIAIRSLLAIAIAAALLRPFTAEERSELEVVKTSRMIGIVIDNSYSMALRESEEGPTGLEKARDAALTLLDDAAPGSRAFVRTAQVSDRSATEQALDLEAARRAVREVRLGGGAFDLLRAIDDACEPLLGGESLPRELHILTDLQKSIAPVVDPDRLRFLHDRLSSRGPVHVILLDCGVAKPSNHFVAELSQEPLAAGLDTPVEITGTVEGSGTTLPADGLALRLIEEGGSVDALDARPAPDGTLATRFTRRLVTSPDSLLTLETPADLLREDDSRFLVVETLDRLPVLVVGDNDSGSGSGTTRFVDLALAPRAGDLLSPPLVFRASLASEITAEGLGTARVVIVTQLSRVGDLEGALLDSFVRRGGGLLLFAGPGLNTLDVNARLFRGGRGVLPASLAPRAGPQSVGPGAGLHPRDVATAHPAISIFKGADEGDLSRVSIRSWSSTTEVSRDSATLANVEAGSPWILERRSGLGRTILITTSASIDDSDLPRTPLFLPLVHRLTRYLAARDPAERTTEVGQPIRWPLPSNVTGGEVTARDPAGVASAAEVVTEDGRKVAVHRRTQLPGFHTLSAVGSAGPVVVHFAANIAREESRLERLDPASLTRLEKGLGVTTVTDVRQATRSTVTRTARRELWPIILCVAILCFFAEQALSRTFARVNHAGQGGSPRSPGSSRLLV